LSNDIIISLSIVVLFLIGIIIVGKIASMRINNTEDYLVANRKAPLYLLIGTLFATFWGGGTIIGAAGSAFEGGLYNVIGDPFAAGLSLVLIGLFFVRTMRKLKIRSLGELYNFRFGKTTGYFASAVMIPTYIIWTSVQLLAIGKIVNVLLGIDFVTAFLVATAVVVCFTYMGGIVAVIWTDLIQMIIILVGLLAIMYVSIKAIGGWSELSAYTPKNFWQFLPREQGIMPWITYIAMWAGMALGNIPSPDIAQRAFIARDVQTAKKGMIITGFLYWTIGFVPIMLALIAIVFTTKGLIPAGLISKDSELLVPILAQKLFGPIGLGIFVASLVAAILSSASTSLFATAVLFSNDIFRPLYEKRMSKERLEKNMLGATKIFVLIVGILAAIFGLCSSSIYDLTIFAFTLQFGALFFPFVFALKLKWVTSQGIIAGMLTGVGINLIGSIIEKSVIPEPWEFYTLVPAFANMVVILVVSCFTQNKGEGRPLAELYLKEQ